MGVFVENTSLTVAASEVPAHVRGVRDYVAIGFRWRYRMLFVFLVTAVAGVLVAFYAPREYQSTMKILVTRERVDPLVAPDQVAVTSPREISEEDLNSEVELIKNDDVLRKVVLATGLQNSVKPSLAAKAFGGPSPNSNELRTAKAIQQLAAALTITLPKKSNVIDVSYKSKDGQL